jgi:hydroxymethylpyrimidine pyrophosphatase-like HAD family hydrolase
MERLKLWSEQYQEHLKPNIQKVDDFHNEILNTNHVWKFVVEGCQEALKDFMSEALVQEHFSAERSWVNRFDFAMKGNVKGTALERYVKRIGGDSSHVVAVGDNFNDLSMLQYAGLGIAMKNAADTVKQHAQLVTEHDHDNESGLAKLLSSIFEQR